MIGLNEYHESLYPWSMMMGSPAGSPASAYRSRTPVSRSTWANRTGALRSEAASTAPAESPPAASASVRNLAAAVMRSPGPGRCDPTGDHAETASLIRKKNPAGIREDSGGVGWHRARG